MSATAPRKIELSRDLVPPEIRERYRQAIHDLRERSVNPSSPSPFPLWFFGGEGCGKTSAARLFAKVLAGWAVDCSRAGKLTPEQEPLYLKFPLLARAYDDYTMGLDGVDIRDLRRALRSTVCLILDDYGEMPALRSNRDACWEAHHLKMAERGYVVNSLPDPVEVVCRNLVEMIARERERKPAVILSNLSPWDIQSRGMTSTATDAWVVGAGMTDVSGLPVWSELRYAADAP